MPFFWSQHYDVPINYVGHAEKWDELAIEGDIAGKDCLLRYKRKGRTLAVASIFRDVASLQAEVAMEREHGGAHRRRARLAPTKSGGTTMADKKSANGKNGKRRLRSRDWFDAPGDPTMAALYLERYMNFGLTLAELHSGRPIIGIAQTGSDLSPCNRHHLDLADARARRHPRRRRHSRSNSRSIRSRRPASGRPPRSTATSPISAWSSACTAISSTASC